MRRRDFLVVLGGSPAVWPLVSAHNRVTGYGALASSFPLPQTICDFRLGLGRSFRAWHYRAGLSAATCVSIRAGPQAMLPNFVNTRLNWSRLLRTLYSPTAIRS